MPKIDVQKLERLVAESEQLGREETSILELAKKLDGRLRAIEERQRGIRREAGEEVWGEGRGHVRFI